MSGGTWTSSSTFTGELYITSGPPYNTPFNTANVAREPRRHAARSTSPARTPGTWTFNVNGISGIKTITRQPF